MLAASLAIVTMRLFVWPATDVARQADAIVILGPGQHGERFLEGERATPWGDGDVMVLERLAR